MAYKYRSKRFKSKKSSRYNKRRPLRSSRVSPRIKSYVKRELARNIENKYKDVQIGPQLTSNIIDNADVVNLCPTILQGTTQSTRIGNKIKIKNCTVRISFTLLPIANIIASPLPTYVDIYLFKTKYQNNWDGGVSATDMQAFLQDDSTSVQYVGNPLDGLRDVNSDLFKSCIHKRLTLYNPTSTAVYPGATASINPNRVLYWNVTKFLKKMWTFEDGVGTCTNDNLQMCVGTSQSDGVSTGASTTGNYYAIVQMKYEDA